MTKCIICGGNTQTYSHPKFDMLFHECGNCEFIFKDEKNHLSSKEELAIYNLHENVEENIGYVNFLTNFVDSAVVPFVQKGKALDFGSGPNPVLAHILKHQYRFDTMVYDLFYASDQGYLDHKFDLITSTEVVEHLKDPMKHFKIFHQLLNPQGVLSVMTLFHPKNRQQFFDWFYIRDPSHLSFFTPKTMITIADLLDFKLIDTNAYRYVVFQK
ncbi:MAG: class I SAM-dependent methyltransferase [Acholeplasmataceae bacterium]|nr:class I SAM-dependent methyltransferase [Acholeplasmataceae bacterium]